MTPFIHTGRHTELLNLLSIVHEPDHFSVPKRGTTHWAKIKIAAALRSRILNEKKVDNRFRNSENRPVVLYKFFLYYTHEHVYEEHHVWSII